MPHEKKKVLRRALKVARQPDVLRSWSKAFQKVAASTVNKSPAFA